MKKIFLSMILFAGTYAAFAQTQPSHPINPVTDQKQNINEMAWDNTNMTVLTTADLPKDINSSFTRTYPNQSGVTWYKYGNGYIASYNDKGNINQRVIYDAGGNPVYVGKQIQPTALPLSTTNYIKTNYPNVQYGNVYQVTTPAGETSYQVWVNGKWMRFDKDGNLVPVK